LQSPVPGLPPSPAARLHPFQPSPETLSPDNPSEFEATYTAFADPDGALEVAVVEHLRVRVQADARAAWLHAEAHSWDPWLRRQPGYLGRDLHWDAEREEGVLLIRWASRAQWKAIPEAEVEAVQARFEALARRCLRREAHSEAGLSANPFPLVHAGELDPTALDPAALRLAA
jgi:uncharacterized protein (TIGR03792 family)